MAKPSDENIRSRVDRWRADAKCKHSAQELLAPVSLERLIDREAAFMTGYGEAIAEAVDEHCKALTAPLETRIAELERQVGEAQKSARPRFRVPAGRGSVAS